MVEITRTVSVVLAAGQIRASLADLLDQLEEHVDTWAPIGATAEALSVSGGDATLHSAYSSQIRLTIHCVRRALRSYRDEEEATLTATPTVEAAAGEEAGQ